MLITASLLTINHPPAIAIVAPHAGKIEIYTSDGAKAIANWAYTFGLYLLEGLRDNYNFETLHLSSHDFDEPRCLQFIRKIDVKAPQVQTNVFSQGCNGNAPTTHLSWRSSS